MFAACWCCYCEIFIAVQEICTFTNEMYYCQNKRIVGLLHVFAAIAMLRDKPPGSFIVRNSNTFQGAFGLALKVAQVPPNVQIKEGGLLFFTLL